MEAAKSRLLISEGHLRRRSSCLYPMGASPTKSLFSDHGEHYFTTEERLAVTSDGHLRRRALGAVPQRALLPPERQEVLLPAGHEVDVGVRACVAISFPGDFGVGQGETRTAGRPYSSPARSRCVGPRLRGNITFGVLRFS